MVRETGPVNLRLSSLRGEGGDYEAEIRCQAIARTLLGGLKERLRLGGIKVGAQRQVLSDGTEIIVATILGGAGMGDTDSVRISLALPVEIEKPEAPVEQEKIIRKITPRLLFGESTGKRIYSLNLATYEITEEFNAALTSMSGLAAGENSFCIIRQGASKINWFTRDWQSIKEITLPSLMGAGGLGGLGPDFSFNVEYAAGRYYVSLRTGANYTDASGNYQGSGIRTHVKVYDETGSELSDTFYPDVWVDWPKTITRNADQPEDDTLYGLCSYGSHTYDPGHIYTGASKVDRYANDLAIAESIALQGLYLAGLAVSDEFYFSCQEPNSQYGADAAETIYKFSPAGKLLASRVLIEAGSGQIGFGANTKAMVWLNERLVIYGFTIADFVYTPTIFVLDENLDSIKQIALDSDLYSTAGFVTVDMYGGDTTYATEQVTL